VALVGREAGCRLIARRFLPVKPFLSQPVANASWC
jgi:hypothetical protein